MAKRSASKTATATAPKATPAEYTVLARRYRPQQFDDLVGQEPVAKALRNALESGRVAHAYVFTGVRGVGKTSTARILAKALNCVKGPTPTPCDQCEICQSIASGEDVDVIEIDGASNTGVDNVRELRQNARNRPSRARYKIYIIDEVHMLSTQAFNALLKTLEEPPAHVKFIFATTEIQKIPVTILSRCQRFDFVGIGTERIVEQLRRIVSDEGMQADDEALEYIARRSGGSMRDGQSLLDQLLAFGAGDKSSKLTLEHVHRLLGTAEDDRVASLAQAVLQRDAKAALELFAQFANDGLNLGELLDQLLAYWRDLMIVRCAGVEGRDLNTPSRQRAELANQAGSRSLETILAGLDILAATKARMRGSGHGRTLIEMALVRLSLLENLVPISELAQWIGQPSAQANAEGPGRGKAIGTGRLASALASTAHADATSQPSPASKNLDQRAAVHERKPLGLTPETTGAIWAQVLAQVGGMLAQSLERAGSIAISGPNNLVIRFSPAYNHAREYCEDPGRLARVQEIVRKVAGQAWQLRIESESTDSAVTSAAGTDADNSLSRYRRQRTQAMQVPLVQRAMEKLGAQIVQVDEGFGTASTTNGQGAEAGSNLSAAEHEPDLPLKEH